jgi:hypothetical protein
VWFNLHVWEFFARIVSIKHDPGKLNVAEKSGARYRAIKDTLENENSGTMFGATSAWMNLRRNIDALEDVL